MSRKKNCKCCQKPSGKSTVCKSCKIEQPYVAASKENGKTFERVQYV